MQPTFEAIAPYLQTIGAASSIATMAFLLNLMQQMRANAHDRLLTKEERMNALKEDIQRTEKWHEREKLELQAQLASLKGQLEELLQGAGIDLRELALGKHLADTANSVLSEVRSVTIAMSEKIERLEEIARPTQVAVDPKLRLTLAMGEMASGSYEAAASQFDRHSSSDDKAWDTHFTRGVAHANARAGAESDLASLRAYNEAIALAPASLPGNFRSRMFCYRGAMFKRLGRLDEAIADFRMAQSLAEADQEILDVNYNLACVYALSGMREEMISHLDLIKHSKRYVRGVLAHRGDYFARYVDDPDFVSLTSL
jgi:tetratricopeptide (TPR) repeat protein